MSEACHNLIQRAWHCHYSDNIYEGYLGLNIKGGVPQEHAKLVDHAYQACLQSGGYTHFFPKDWQWSWILAMNYKVEVSALFNFCTMIPSETCMGFPYSSGCLLHANVTLATSVNIISIWVLLPD